MTGTGKPRPWTLSRRHMLRLLAMAAAVVMLLACSPVAEERETETAADSTDPSAPTESAGEAKRGGTLRIGRTTDIVELAPGRIGTPQSVYLPAVFNRLLYLDQNLEPVPELAESFELSDDKKEFRISLRQGVQFHSGREFTSEDVKYNIERAQDESIAVQLAPLAQAITEIEMPDEYTVVLRGDEPMIGLLGLLDVLYMGDQETIEGPDAATEAVGTGPFSLEEWLPGESYELVRNEDYWDEGKPYLDKVVVQVVGDAQGLVAQVQSGAIDFADGLPETLVAQFQDSEDFRVATNDLASAFYYVAANTSKPPLDDVRVRQAINHAINRDRFVESGLSGLGEKATVPWPQASTVYDESYADAVEFDLDKARSLLEEAGVSDVNLEITTLADFPVLVDQAEVLRSDLEQIGITLTTNPVPVAEWSESWQNDEHELISGILGTPIDVPALGFQRTVPLQPNSPFTKWNDDRFAELVEEATVEPDDDRRTELTRELTELLLEESPVMPFARLVQATPVSQRVQGFEYPANGEVVLTETWVEDS